MRYDGGKGAMGLAQWIINQIPPHAIYIEPFLGGGAVLRFKRPAGSTVAIERDAGVAAQWRKIDIVPDLHVICGDAISWLSKFKPRGDEFIYCDPPYLFSTRASLDAMYRCELHESDHVRLLSILKRLRCSIAISGYWSRLYSDMLNGWRATQFLTTKRNHKLAEEWLWMNYPEPIALHDYRYLGRNFRERERIKRKKKRWRNRLAAMPLLERRLLVATLAEVDGVRSCTAISNEVGRTSATSTIDVGTDGNGDATRSKNHPEGIAGVGENRRRRAPKTART